MPPPPPPPPPAGAPAAAARAADPLAGPVERIDEEWGTLRGAPPSKPAPERAGKPLENDHFAYTEDRRPLAYRGAWKIGEPDISPRRMGADARGRHVVRAFLPKGTRKWAVAAFVVATAVSFYVTSMLAPLLDEALGDDVPQGAVAFLATTYPPGAKVLVDGAPLPGRTPLLADVDLTPGKHEVLLSLPGGEETKTSVTVEAGQRWLSVRESLASGGEVRIETRPKGARIRLDGKAVGESPLTLEDVSYDGAHRIEAKLDGYLAQQVELPTDRPPVHVVKLRMQKAGKMGKVVFVTQPTSEVWLDGKALGQAGLEERRAPVGDHEARFLVPGLGVDVTYNVEVPESGVARYYFDLTSGGE